MTDLSHIKDKLKNEASKLPVLCQISEITPTDAFHHTVVSEKVISIDFYRTNYYVATAHYKPISKIIPIKLNARP